MLDEKYLNVHIEILKKGTSSSPQAVLKKMKKRLEQASLKNDDEAWLVIDKDQWQDEQIRQLYNWSQEKPNYHLAVSNPCFELWLLLHFDNGDGCATTKHDCEFKLKQYDSNYDKNIRTNLYEPHIADAVANAKRRDNQTKHKWAQTPGVTDVYHFVEHICKADSEE
jgi:hypothetical protein